MKSWIDTYPHPIYASVLVLNGKVMDYKIGQRKWTHVYDVTLRGQIELDDLFKCEVKSIDFTANNELEHGNVFEVLAKDWIREQGEYKHFDNLVIRDGKFRGECIISL